MFGVGSRRRIVTVVVVALLGLTGLPDVDVPAAAEPPQLDTPEVEPPIPTDVPAPENAQSVPDDWADPVPGVVQQGLGTPVRDRELVEERTATREVWLNTDGTKTAVLHSEPVFHQAAGGAWEPVDTTLVADPERPGWLTTTANSWTARFGPIEPGAVGGVQLETPAGLVRIVPDLAEGHSVNGPVAATIAPVAAGDTVTYADVWPGVDLAYRVTGGNLRQQIVLRQAGCETVRFVVEGLDLVPGDRKVVVASAQAGLLDLQPLEVTYGPGKQAGEEAAPALHLPAGAADLVGDDPKVPGEPQFLAMSVAGAWLDRSLHGGEGPVVVGATTNVGPTVLDAFRRSGTAADLSYHDGLRLGGGPGDADPQWRSAGRYDYLPVVDGRQVLQGRLVLAGRADANAYDVDVFVRSADGSSFVGAAGELDGVGQATNWTELTVAAGADDVVADVTALLHHWQFTHRTDGIVGVVGDEDSPVDTLLRFDAPRLEVTVNDVPPGPGLREPAADAVAVTTDTPTLAWDPVADPDGSPVSYAAQITTGVDGDSGLVVTSPAGDATQWTVPAGVLRDGFTYSWRVFASDGRAWTSSEVRRLRVDRGLGVSASHPVDEVGGLTTNLASGNAMLRVPGAELASASGEVGVDLVYNSLAAPRGLTAVYRADADQDTEIDRSDPVRLARTDAQISFDWTGATLPSPGVPREWFSAQWTGILALPPGDWQLGARADDGVRIRIDGTSVVDRWQMGVLPDKAVYQEDSVAGGASHAIEVDYFQAFAGAGLELWARSAADPAIEFVVPAAWLSPAGSELPTGWALQAADRAAPYTRAIVSEGSVTLQRRDGSTTALTATVGAPGRGGSGAPTVLGAEVGFTPSPGMSDVVGVDADGSVTVQSPGGTTSVFRPDGRLGRVTSAVADHKPLAAVAAYDPAGRIERLTDPVSGRSTTFSFAPSPDCPGEAPAGALCRIAYWDGTATDLQYAGRLLASVRNPGEAAWAFGYDAAGRLTGFVDPLGFDVALAGGAASAVDHQVGYDAAGRVVSVAQPLVAQSRRPRSYSYGEGTTTVVRDGIDTPFRIVAYDGRGRLVTETDSAGAATTRVWDDADRMVSTDAPDGLRTATTYDNLGRPVVAWGPAPVVSFNPDGSGQDSVPRTTTAYDEGADGLEVAFWDNAELVGGPARHGFQAGSPATLAIPEGLAAARLTGHLVFPLPGTYVVALQSAGRARLFLGDTLAADTGAEVTTTVAGEARRVRLDVLEPGTLDLQWTPPGAAGPEPVPTTALQPGFDLPTTTVDPDGVVTRFDYRDEASEVGPQHRLETRSVVDPHGLNLVTSSGYEPVGTGYVRLLSRTRPAGPATATAVTYYGDAEMRDNPCTREGDRANQAGLVKFDASADPDGEGPGLPLVWETVYGASGRQVARRAVGDEEWTCTSYDGRGRVATESYPDGRAVTYAYSATPDGTLATAVTDPVGTVTTTTNVLGEPLGGRDVFGAEASITYDSLGRMTGTASGAGTLAKTYDAADRLTTVSRDGGVVANGLVYDAAGRPTAVGFPTNGTSGVIGYGLDGRLASVSWTGSDGGAVTSDVVARRAGGGVADEIVDGEEHHPGDDYVQDAAGRLVDAWVPGQHLSYQFAVLDGCGPLLAAGANSNRTHQRIEGGPVTCYCYDNADRLTAADTATGAVTYDAHGNTTAIYGETHRYDGADRLVEVAVPNGPTVSYRYDALGRLVERTVGSETIRYRYAGSTLAFTTDAAGTVLDALVELPGRVVLSARAGGEVWSYPNVAGDYVATTDATGRKQGPTTIYDPLGDVVSGTTPDNLTGNVDQGWQSELTDHEPGLHPRTLQRS